MRFVLLALLIFIAVGITSVLVSYLVEALRRSPILPQQLRWAPDVPIRYLELDGNRIRSSAVLGCGLLLSVGCAVGPDFVAPRPPVAEGWHETTDEVITEEPADYGAWWEGFHDGVLNKLIDTAYDENLTLQVAAIRVLEARALLRDTEALLPLLETGVLKSQHAISTLIGRPPGDLSDVLGAGALDAAESGKTPDKTIIPSPPPDIAVGAPVDLLRRRPDVRRAELEARRFARERTLTGAVSLYREEKISFEVAGRVLRVLDQGLEVRGPAYNEADALIRQGDRIARLESTRYGSAVRGLEARLVIPAS